jgi:hypothetical protein
MEHRFVRFSAVLSLLAAAAFSSPAALAQYKCDNPTRSIDKRACAKAAESPEALNRFIGRTRVIWNLYFPDYMRYDDGGNVIKPVTFTPAPTEVPVGKHAAAADVR